MNVDLYAEKLAWFKRNKKDRSRRDKLVGAQLATGLIALNPILAAKKA
jgi:hypothetical protein